MVSHIVSGSVVNRLIESLPRKTRNQFFGGCKQVDMVFGDVLCEAGLPIRHVYFPVTGFVSLVTILEDRPLLEMGLIGYEGMLGVTLILGVDAAPLRAVVQGSGTALCMTARQFQRECRNSRVMLNIFNRYLYVLMAQLAQVAACNQFHEIEVRLARWLLMTHDRAHADHFHLTHEFLANMLGVRRSGITVAAGALQLRKLIRYVRGEIFVLDRRGLEAVACECYAAAVDDYERLLGSN